jgi:hypothetical protein
MTEYNDHFSKEIPHGTREMNMEIKTQVQTMGDQT